MFRARPFLPALATTLLLMNAGPALADDAGLPVGQDVSISLPAGGAVNYGFPNLSGATLVLRLSAGDVDVNLASPDQTNSSHSSLSGSGTSVISFQGGSSGVALQLASTGGAQFVLNVAPGLSGGGTSVISTSGSSSSVVSSNTSVSVNQQVSTSGGSVTATGGGSHVVIDNNGSITVSSSS